MALNVKQKYPVTQGGAAQLYASDTRLSLRRREQVFTRLSKSYKENMDISSTSSSSSSSSILPCNFFVFLFLPGSVDATWRIYSLSLRMCARQDCSVFERPQVVFYCNFSCSRHVSKSANLIGRIVFDVARQTKKTNPRRSFCGMRNFFTCHQRWKKVQLCAVKSARVTRPLPLRLLWDCKQSRRFSITDLGKTLAKCYKCRLKSILKLRGFH